MAKQGEHGISWTNETWNPIRGCSRVSEGCTRCYAERTAARYSGPGEPYDGLAKFVTVSKGTLEEHQEARWTGELQFVEKHLKDPLRWAKPRMVFVNSMSDLFHEKCKEEWIDKIFAVMALRPRHQFQVLTKRPERMRDYLDPLSHRGEIVWHEAAKMDVTLSDVWPLPNVWMGVSVENQTTADERIPILSNTAARVRWVSYEPALGPIDFTRIDKRWDMLMLCKTPAGITLPRMIDWVVCGGESGPGARPMHPDWARSARDQCVAAGVPYFFKQWGEWVDPEQCVCALHSSGEHGYVADGRKHSDGCPNAKKFVVKVGKKIAGDLLDGQQWHEFPK